MPLMGSKGHEFKPCLGQLARTIHGYSGHCSIVILLNYLRIKTSYDSFHLLFTELRTDAVDHWILMHPDLVCIHLISDYMTVCCCAMVK